MNKLNVLLATATAAAIALCTAAQAGTQDQQRTVTVQYSVTQVVTAQDVRKLYGQLHAAARSVCGEIDAYYRLAPTLPGFDTCVRQTLSRAVMQIHQPALTAYAAVRGVAAGPALAALTRVR